MAGKGQLLPVLLSTVCLLFTLYSPQPLLPFFAAKFGVTEATSGLLLTVTMLPLALAPLSYGYLLGYMRPLQLLRVSLIGLAVLTFLLPLTRSFYELLFIRFLQGLLLPAGLTAVMSHLAATAPTNTLQRSMSLYVAATITGGFSGRLLAGVTAALADWRLFFFLLAVLLSSCLFFLKSEQSRTQPHRRPIVGWTGITACLSGRCWALYLSIFFLFFVFCGLLNYLPFRTVSLAGTSSPLLTGIMYSGYIMGIATSLGASNITAKIGSEKKTMYAGYALFLTVLVAMFLPQALLLFLLLFPFCGAMFLVHSLAASAVNARTNQYRPLANGIYLCHYYGGGVLGSYFPGLFYEYFGWWQMLFFLLFTGLAGFLLLAWFLRDHPPAQ